MKATAPYSVLPTQWALLVHNVVMVANFITALLVPWVEANYRIANGWFPVYVPVDIGLLKCFSDICNVKQPSQGGGKGGGGKGSLPNQFGPGGGGGPGESVDSGGGGAKILFEIAAVFGVIFLSAAVLLALGSAVLEIARVQGQADVTPLLPLQLSMLSALLCLVALLQYLFITIAGLHGGQYELGFWLTLATAVLTGLLALGQLLINKKYYGEPAYEGLFLPSHLQQQQQQQGGSGSGGCKKGCCGAPKAGGSIAQPSYGSQGPVNPEAGHR